MFIFERNLCENRTNCLELWPKLYIDKGIYNMELLLWIFHKRFNIIKLENSLIKTVFERSLRFTKWVAAAKAFEQPKFCIFSSFPFLPTVSFSAITVIGLLGKHFLTFALDIDIHRIIENSTKAWILIHVKASLVKHTEVH